MTTARRTGATTLTTLVACVAAFILVNALAPQWAQSAGIDFWAAPDAMEQQREQKQREVELDGQMDSLAEQIAASESIAASVIEDRICLAEGVTQVLEVNRDRTGFLISLRTQFYPETSDRALCQCYLIEKIQARLANDPSRREEVMNRLTCR